MEEQSECCCFINIVPWSITGGRTYILTCVGLASTPRLFNKRQNCQADLLRTLCDSSMITAFRRPRPRTSFTSGDFKSLIAVRNFSPRMSARFARSSSTNTDKAVIATAQPRGLLKAHVSSVKRMDDMRHPNSPSIGATVLAGLNA